MRTLVEYKPSKNKVDLPVLRMFIHHAPHRRQHLEVIKAYRKELIAAANAAKIKIPICDPVSLWVLFVNPCSCDLDNLISALYRAIDGYLLEDDSLIEEVVMSKFYPCEKTKSEPPRRQKYRK